MPRTGLPLGRVAGVSVRVTPSWFLIAALITLLYAGTVASYTGAGVAAYAGAFGFALLLAASVLVHEAAHAVAARSFGLVVDEVVVDLWGGHTSLGAPRRPLEAAVVAVVAPLSNLVLAAAIWGVLVATRPSGLVGFLLGATALANVLVGLFNLLPGLPLDGGRVTEAVVWAVTGDRDRGTEVAGWAGRAVVVVSAALVLGLPLATGGSPSLVAILWVVLLGATLWRSASRAVVVSRTRRRVAAIDLRRLTAPVVLLGPQASVADWTAAQDAGPGRAALLAGPDGRVAAVVDPAAAAAVPAAAAPATRADAVAIRMAPDAALPTGASTVDVAERLQRVGGPGVLLVTDEGLPAGWVAATDLDASLRRVLGTPRERAS